MVLRRSGDVLEIGPGHEPFPIAPDARVRFADRSVKGGRDQNWPELVGSPHGPEADLNITQKEGELQVSGNATSNGEADTEYLYRGIAGRTFERHFQLADHVKVMGANLANGLLTIDSRRPRPDAAAA